ncbi:pentapeptide repeat-containing protein [Microbacterium sp. LRZ72]|uniref:hypothetical protein n=1 Tax=Microbacterium sp. LRZ72 TaxID=2942481 RepID=UPI0029B32A0C|nr:hypothetical protein [Microbacterium sp. LRZ72]MDX2377925.1 pentapeptide repeat-containing protein [Microbacterium sp. LRZ72]
MGGSGGDTKTVPRTRGASAASEGAVADVDLGVLDFDPVGFEGRDFGPADFDAVGFDGLAADEVDFDELDFDEEDVDLADFDPVDFDSAGFDPAGFGAGDLVPDAPVPAGFAPVDLAARAADVFVARTGDGAPGAGLARGARGLRAAGAPCSATSSP